MVGKLTREDLTAAARDRLRPDDMFIVVLGPLTRDQLGLDGVTWIEE